MSDGPLCFADIARRSRVFRRGFTIVEVVVALMLLACGALAAVAATSGAVQAVASAEAQLAATTTARTRVEALAARGCAEARAGSASDSVRGIREAWSISPPRNGLRLASASVSYSDRGTAGVATARRLLVC